MIIEIQQTASVVFVALMALSWAMNVNPWLIKKIPDDGLIDKALWYFLVLDVVVALIVTELRIWGFQ